ncbi:transporter substrate-binding domain-containing protein [Pantoea ananatis]|uniref:transporter substrate-binding domain-containing protein n=1 Tax=Pantoea ananas TaxID=553 RepID=UPI003FA414B3
MFFFKRNVFFILSNFQRKFVLNFLLLSLLFISGAGTALSEEVHSVRIGVDLTYPPFQDKSATGEPNGFEIDLTRAICKAMNLKCSFVVNTFDAQIPALLARKIDVISPLGVTKKRSDAIAFSNYVFHVPTVLIAKKESDLLPDANSLRGKSIAVQQGTIQEIYAKKYLLPLGVDIKSYQDSEAIYQDLHAGRIEGAICPSVAATFGFLRTQEGSDFETKGQEITDADIFSIGSAYGIRKDDKKTIMFINAGLKKIKKDGTYEAIQKKYFGDLDLSVK